MGSKDSVIVFSTRRDYTRSKGYKILVVLVCQLSGSSSRAIPSRFHIRSNSRVSGGVSNVSLSVKLIEKPCFGVQTLGFHLTEPSEVCAQELHLNRAGTRTRQNVIASENLRSFLSPLKIRS